MLLVSDWLNVDGSLESFLIPTALDPAPNVSGKLIPGTDHDAFLIGVCVPVPVAKVHACGGLINLCLVAGNKALRIHTACS